MTMKAVLAACALILAPTMATAQEVTAEATTKIQALLKDMSCEVAPENIEAGAAGYELDDVFCADGQYDMDLDKDFKVTNKKKE